uniref:Uncharacterized protein n=1 Tax=Plectus sambesii TaxID=2011161 RepID=A0A914WBE6_9BILA
MNGLAQNQQASGICLNLSSCLDTKCLTVLQQLLPGIKCVEKLIVRNNSMGKALAMLLPRFGDMENLRTLDIGGENFEVLIENYQFDVIEEILELILTFLQDAKKINTLILSDCQLKEHLNCMIYKLINSGNTSLRTIDISGNQIGDTGAAILSEALKKNQTLKSVILDKNGIGEEGVWKLSEAFHHNTTLTSLSAQTSLKEITKTANISYQYHQNEEALIMLEEGLKHNQKLHNRPDSKEKKIGTDILIAQKQCEQELHEASTFTGNNQDVYSAANNMQRNGLEFAEASEQKTGSIGTIELKNNED